MECGSLLSNQLSICLYLISGMKYMKFVFTKFEFNMNCFVLTNRLLGINPQ